MGWVLRSTPLRGEELRALDASAFVDSALDFAHIGGQAVGNDFAPGDVAVAFDDGVGLAGDEASAGHLVRHTWPENAAAVSFEIAM